MYRYRAWHYTNFNVILCIYDRYLSIYVSSVSLDIYLVIWLKCCLLIV